MEIIKLNNNDWEKASFILNHYLEKGLLKKEIRGPEDIIYRVVPKSFEFELVYDVKYKVPLPEPETPRVRRKRIEK